MKILLVLLLTSLFRAPLSYGSPGHSLDPLVEAEDQRNPDAAVLKAALSSGRIHSPKGIDPLLSLLKDENSSVRKTAAFRHTLFLVSKRDKKNSLGVRALVDAFKVLKSESSANLNKLSFAADMGRILKVEWGDRAMDFGLAYRADGFHFE